MPDAGVMNLPTGLPGNAQAVGDAINAVVNGGGTLPPGFQNLIGLSGPALTNALSQLSGEGATGGQQAAFDLMTEFLALMTDPFIDRWDGAGGVSSFAPVDEAALPPELASAYAAVFKAPVMTPVSFDQRWSLWGTAFGGANSTRGDPNGVGSHDLTAHTGGFAAGADYRVSAVTTLGFALAGGGTGWSLAQGLGGGHSDAFEAGIYGRTHAGPAYLSGSFGFANHWMSTDRFAAGGDHLTASFNAQSVGTRIEGGYRFATAFAGITPYAAVQAQSFSTPSFQETDLTGGGFGLAFADRTATDTRAELGSRFDRLMLVDQGTVLALRGRLAYAHDWVSDPALAAVFQALPGASFIVNGATPAHDSALVSTSAELRFVGGVSIGAKFDGELAAHSQTYAGTATVRYRW